MHGDGNGWVECALGHRHWGVYGAAGLLLRRRLGPGIVQVLMQHRAPWTNDGDTWGLPGGARDSHESAGQAALREAAEEAGVPADAVAVRGELSDDHGGWSYVTVIADALSEVTVVPNAESVALRWVEEDDVDQLRLHPGFAATWPELLRRRL